MALHSTRKQANFKLSLKKKLIDGVGDALIFFQTLSDIPETAGTPLSKWVVVQLGNRTGEDLVEQFVFLHLFTNGDNEGDELSELQDTVMGALCNSDGELVPFTLYNTVPDTWLVIGGVVVFEQAVSEELEDFNGVKFKTITLLCKWNAV